MLDKKSYRVLKLLYRRGRCSFEDIQSITGHNEISSSSEYIRLLGSLGFISKWESDDLIDIEGYKEYKPLGYSITIQGIAYVESVRRNGRNFWIPYTITTVIALMSLLDTLLVLLCND